MLSIKNAFPSNITYLFLERLFSKWGKENCPFFSNGEQTSGLFPPLISLLWQHCVWPGSISGETARTQGFTQKWEAHLFLCFTVSHDHSVFTALLLVTHWTKKVRPSRFREMRNFLEGVLGNQTWSSSFFSPVWQQSWNANGTDFGAPLHDCVWDLEEGKLKGSCDTIPS